MGFRRKIEKTRPLVEALDEVAAAHGVTVAQVALNWLIHFHGETVVAIPGATKPYQVVENSAAMGFALSGQDMARIDEVSRSVA
jgi:aryl-alcohol dehydrogenase-like predicted oxidoreductase